LKNGIVIIYAIAPAINPSISGGSYLY